MRREKVYVETVFKKHRIKQSKVKTNKSLAMSNICKDTEYLEHSYIFNFNGMI